MISPLLFPLPCCYQLLSFIALSVHGRESSAGIALRDACGAAALFLLEYTDGFTAALLHAGAGGHVSGWAYGAKLPTGEVQATALTSTGATTRRGGAARGPPYPHFAYLSLNVQEMFLTGKAQCDSRACLQCCWLFAGPTCPHAYLYSSCLRLWQVSG